MKEEEIKNKLIRCNYFPTQPKVSLVNILEYVQMLKDGSPAPAIKVDENLIIDGHHRFIAGVIFGKLPEEIPWTKAFSTKALNWKDIIFDNVLWKRPK